MPQLVEPDVDGGIRNASVAGNLIAVVSCGITTCYVALQDDTMPGRSIMGLHVAKIRSEW